MVAESRAWGADLVLLIVAVLGARTRDLVRAARAFGMEALVEVHDERELEIAAGADAAVVGINNRDLRTFRVDLGTAERLLPAVPAGCLKVVESGIRSVEEIRRFAALGADAVLVGERLVGAPDPAAALAEIKKAAWQEHILGEVRAHGGEDRPERA